ncbi:Fructosamine kinase-domain-containing protein [Apiospora marii]|uniref:Fructosamine kinase-domain-containing protein n=1 Tax=Apiospora marii TaxID=335849 RepID=A0ABR1RF11_9PEZI
MAESEYKAMALLFPAMTMMMPRPVAWGAYKDTPDTWFYLCQYFELSGDVPEFYELAACLGELHRQSARAGDFGLDLVTYGGKNTEYFPPCRTWEETFSKGLQWTFDFEEDSTSKKRARARMTRCGVSATLC